MKHIVILVWLCRERRVLLNRGMGSKESMDKMDWENVSAPWWPLSGITPRASKRPKAVRNLSETSSVSFSYVCCNVDAHRLEWSKALDH